MTADKAQGEGNRLIAEFVGYKVGSLHGWMSGHRTYAYKLNDKEDVDEAIPINSLKYHSSWDWLMPVVEKIEKKFIVCIWWDCCEISAEKKRMTYPPMLQSRGETKIQATWDCIVKFIQWYKLNSK